MLYHDNVYMIIRVGMLKGSQTRQTALALQHWILRGHGPPRLKPDGSAVVNIV
jgi:hypothetical protein